MSGASTLAQPAEAPDRERRLVRVEHLLLAVVAFVPQLLTEPGRVVSDNNAYLYLDVGRLLRQSAQLWSPQYLGSVTYQQSGYLFPIGPFFWVWHTLGVPVWVAERLWVGSLLFAAGSGVLYLCRTFGLRWPGRPVAALAFMASPYFLQVIGRQSGLLLPWAATAWLLALTVRSVRSGGWRYPALFALVWVTASSTNATGALLALIGPALWAVYAVWVSRQRSFGDLWAATWRIGILSVGVSLWWVAVLAVEGRYGIDVLLYTESIRIEAITSLASEVFRGLGYWYFYGGDQLGPWQPPLRLLTQSPVVLALSFAVPVLALVLALRIRWRHRGFFVLLVVVAMLVAVGAHPFDHSSVFGAVMKVVLRSKAGNALRSSDRAAPTLVLGLAMLLGAGLEALTARNRRRGLFTSALAACAVLGANPALFDGTTAPARYSFPVPLPAYVSAASHWLDSKGSTPVLAIPGQTFAAYRYGTSLDPVWPGVLRRPYVERRILPDGSLPTFDLLFGLDAPVQTATVDPAAVAPLARLMGVGDVLVQNDLQYELYNEADPRVLARQLGTPPGLGAPVGFGDPVPNQPKKQAVDARTLALAPGTPWPAPVVVYPVTGTRPLVRAEPTTGALVVDGDGPGLAALAGIGVLDTSAPVLYSASMGAGSPAFADAMAGGATLAVTDTNRKQAFSYASVQDNAVATLTKAQQEPANTVDVFPHGPAGSQSVLVISGVADVTASYSSKQYAAMAIDGDPATAWLTQSSVDPLQQFWQVTLSKPQRLDSLTIRQPVQTGYNYDQWITRATLVFNGGDTRQVALTASSRSGAGQVVRFPARTVRKLRIVVDRTNLTGAKRTKTAEASPVGLAEVGLGQARATTLIAMPTDLLSRAGSSAATHDLLFVTTRSRNTLSSPDADPEPVLARRFVSSGTRRFVLHGQARLSGAASDQALDAALGRPTAGAVAASSSSRLESDAADTAAAALDGNPATVWSPALGLANQRGAWIEADLPSPRTVSSLDLQVVADRQHSLPSRLEVRACNAVGADGRCPAGSAAAEVALPRLAWSRTPGTVETVPVHFAGVTGSHFTVTFTSVRTRSGYDDTTSEYVALPMGIAELGMPGVHVAGVPESMPGTCRSDLLTLDGRPLWTAVTGSTASAQAGKPLAIGLCGSDAGGVVLGPGSHTVRAATAQATGLDVDEMALESPAPAGVAAGTAPRPAPQPVVHVRSPDPASFQVRVSHASGPFWLVLGQSINAGWRASGAPGTKAAPSLVDGFANGWLVTPDLSGRVSLTLTWTPQGTVDAGLVVSALAALACLAVILRTRRRRPAVVADEPPALRDEGRAAFPALPLGRAAAVALGLTVFGAVVLPVTVLGIGVGAVALLAMLTPEGRALLRGGALAMAGGGALYVVLTEAIQRFGSLGWPGHFELAGQLVWVAIVLLAADVVIDRVLDDAAAAAPGPGSGARAGRGPELTALGAPRRSAPTGSPPPSPPT